jgi:L-amino acid N-acyltransferase YncA
LPAHRRKGLYTALLNQTTDQLKEMGFQKIYSRHSATNNDVIIPKLKFGFTITSLEISDIFGVLVHLVYFPKELRRKMMVYRVGDIKPDDEIRKCLDI